jgi:PKD repeat protein
VLATSIVVTANPDTVALGQSANVQGQQSLILIRVFDAAGQPKPNQALRLETLVNGKLSDCGQISQSLVVTGADGQASTVFTAPPTPPDCPSFNTDGSVTIRATPIGTDFKVSFRDTGSVNLFMALPSAGASTGPFTVNFSISPNPGKKAPELVTFSDAGSVSPGHSIVSYRWTWSDGATKNGSSVQHDFASAGSYTATLTVTDDAQQVAFKTAIVTITD